MDNDKHCYIVSYDLCNPTRNYNQLYMALKSFGYWGKLTESTWAIVSDWPAVQIRDKLIRYIGHNDRLVVILSGKSAAWNNLLASNDWVRNTLVL